MAGLFVLPIVPQAQFTYTTNNGTITITGYTGPGGVVTIPGSIDGILVTDVGYQAFSERTDVTSVEIPNSVTGIGIYSFSGSGLTSVTIPSSVAVIGEGA